MKELAPLVERPLVTFALLAYNQEKYIREAVNGVLAQTYDPMEIILSDDCSTDSTFAILQETASAYLGEKKIIVRQTKSNCGTLLHVGEVSKIACGEFLVLAAGDDISKPQRTEVLVRSWQGSGAWGLCSRFDRIDESGRLTAQNQTVEILASPNYPLRRYFSNKQNEVQIVHGATSAYDRRLFEFLDIGPEDYILSEDGALSVLLNMLDKSVKMLDESLIYYRENQQSLTNSGHHKKNSFEQTRNDEFNIERFARSQAQRCVFFLRLQEKYGVSSSFTLDTERLRKELVKQHMRARWRSTRFIERIHYFLKIRDIDELKWYFPRMLPNIAFIALKTLIKDLRQRLYSFLKE